MPDLRRFAPADRDNDPQAIIALAVTREGVPVRSWIFPGNTSDVAAVNRIKDDLRGMTLGRTLFVGDAGMYAAANLKELSKGAGRYVLATPIRVASKRFGRYLSLDDKGRPYLDKDKVKRAEHLDGKFVLTTNDDTLSVADIALGYKGMWIIESCFKKMKTTGLEVRPMLHWMPQRFTAHVKRCVLALMIQRAAELATELPWSRLTATLAPLEAVKYTSENSTIDHPRRRLNTAPPKSCGHTPIRGASQRPDFAT